MVKDSDFGFPTGNFREIFKGNVRLFNVYFKSFVINQNKKQDTTFKSLNFSCKIFSESLMVCFLFTFEEKSSFLNESCFWVASKNSLSKCFETWTLPKWVYEYYPNIYEIFDDFSKNVRIPFKLWK